MSKIQNSYHPKYLHATSWIKVAGVPQNCLCFPIREGGQWHWPACASGHLGDPVLFLAWSQTNSGQKNLYLLQSEAISWLIDQPLTLHSTSYLCELVPSLCQVMLFYRKTKGLLNICLEGCRQGSAISLLNGNLQKMQQVRHFAHTGAKTASSILRGWPSSEPQHPEG